MKVVMMGLGYIGLPTAALIASKEINVVGVDINKNIVDTINKGNIHIIEPDLEGLVSYVVKNSFLKASEKCEKADVFIIAVPTPFKNDHEPDISFVESAVDMIIPFIEEGNLIILESTSPVGTTEIIVGRIFLKRKELKDKIFISYCPERVLPGRVIYELENNDRVIGGLNDKSSDKAFDFYSLFVKGKLHKSNAKTAEMCKLVENSYRDVNIAFANELSMICDKADINVYELINLTNKHPRVKILTPGSGVGGHCIAVDPWFLVHDYKDQAKIIRTAREINNYKTEWVIDKIKSTSDDFENKNNKKPTIACLGLAFKPDIDDLRESPAVHIVKQLLKDNLNLSVVEPNIKSHKDFSLSDLNTALNKSDIIVFLVAHSQFKNLNIKNKIILDFCGIK